MSAINQFGAAITIMMGLLGLLAPQLAATLVGLEARTPAGHSEFRATYGGLWLPLGGLPLLSGAPALYGVAGACWAGAACGRLVSIVIDKAATPKNFVALGFEALVGAMLLWGPPADALRQIIVRS